MGTESGIAVDLAGVADHGAVGLDELLRRQIPRLLRLAYGILGDAGAAEDAVQDTLVLAWRHWHTVRDGERSEAWLARICVRRAIRSRQGLLRRLRHEAPGDAALVAVVDPAQDGRADLDWDRCFRTLSPPQRAVVVLHYQHDHSLDDCARLMGCRPGTARTHLSRALAKLRVEVRDDHD
jgi:RNA polymerase sigma factor (sigma-70 family)